MDYKLENFKKSYINAKKVLNEMHLHNKLGHYAWLIDCLVLVFSNI